MQISIWSFRSVVIHSNHVIILITCIIFVFFIVFGLQVASLYKPTLLLTFNSEHNN